MTSSSTSSPVQLGIFSNLGLSATQTQQIQSIVGNAQNGSMPFTQVLSKVEALLTPAQQATFKNDLQTLEAGVNHRHHGGGGAVASSALSSMLSSSTPDAFGAASSTTPTSTLTTDAFGNSIATPGSALADAFGVMSTSNASSTATGINASAIASNSVANNLTSNTPNASNVYSPFSVVAARYQVQGQLQASSLDNFLT